MDYDRSTDRMDRDQRYGEEPEATQEGVREWTNKMVENRLNQLTVELVAMLRMCNDPNEAWKEAKVRVDAMLVWHQES